MAESSNPVGEPGGEPGPVRQGSPGISEGLFSPRRARRDAEDQADPPPDRETTRSASASAWVGCRLAVEELRDRLALLGGQSLGEPVGQHRRAANLYLEEAARTCRRAERAVSSLDVAEIAAAFEDVDRLRQHGEALDDATRAVVASYHFSRDELRS